MTITRDAAKDDLHDLRPYDRLQQNSELRAEEFWGLLVYIMTCRVWTDGGIGNTQCGHPLDGRRTICIIGLTALGCWSQVTVTRSAECLPRYWSLFVVESAGVFFSASDIKRGQTFKAEAKAEDNFPTPKITFNIIMCTTQTVQCITVSYLLSFVNVIIIFIPHTPINS